MEAHQRLGGLIKKTREGKGLSQAHLAKALGVAQMTICYIEQGQRLIDPSAFDALQEALDQDNVWRIEVEQLWCLSRLQRLKTQGLRFYQLTHERIT